MVKIKFLVHLPVDHLTHIIIIIIIIISSSSSSSIVLFIWESALADDFPLEFEWQQVSLSLKDSSQYSGRSQ